MARRNLRNFLRGCETGVSLLEVVLIVSLCLLIAFPAVRRVGFKARDPLCRAGLASEHYEVAQLMLTDRAAMCCISGEWQCKFNQAGPACTPQQMVACGGPSGPP